LVRTLQIGKVATIAERSNENARRDRAFDWSLVWCARFTRAIG
jgi:hypothetical protein